MQNISLQRIIIFFIGMYFLVSFWPLRLAFLNSYIPGQLIPLFFITIFSLLSTKITYEKSKNIDLKIVCYFLLYILLNCIIQGTFDSNFIEYRISSLVGSLIPILLFFVFMSFDINDKVLDVILRYLFFGLVIYSVYYIESFTSRSMMSDGPHIRVIGQRDALYLNFAFLLLFFKNYHSNYFFKALGLISALGLLYIALNAQTRLGYILLLINIFVLTIIYKKYFFQIFLPLIAIFIVSYFVYFRGADDVYELITSGETNRLKYSIARFNTIVNSLLSFFSEDYHLGGSESIRFLIWDKILEAATHNPLTFLFGSGELGVHSLNESYLMDDTTGRQYAFFREIKTAESQFFDTLFRRGFIGLIFFFTILFRLVYLANYLRHFDQKFKDLYLAVYIWLIGVSFTLFYLPFMRDRAFSLFFFIVYAILSSRAYVIRSNFK